ncbi:MAG: hemerythrin domain-containing protein [Spirochaetales bacterium]|nr:hemerythrin domain-containing protein [Spirochaetales bacterium]
MKAFVWSKYFVTGITQIDDQHKKLVELVNELGEITVDGVSSSVNWNDILDRLINYTKYHFKDEEKLMIEYKIAKRHFTEHVKRH